MKIRKFEKGQTIVIIALSIIGLVAMAALIIDGSNSYLNRRKAQTAADAAALAGAREMCIARGSTGSITDVVYEYALTQNQATEIYDLQIDQTNKTVSVTTELTADTFFAKVFNQQTRTVRATAASGCYNPASGKGVLPIGWMCKNIDDNLEWQSGDCKYKALDWNTQFAPLLDPTGPPVLIDGVYYDAPFDFSLNSLPYIYVIMDTMSLEDGANGHCIPDGDLPCDFDGDGKNDFLGKGEGGFLDLDGGGGGADELIDWIDDGYPGLISIHTWIGGQPGDINSVFQTIEDHLYEVFVLPVFNITCPYGEPEPDPNPDPLINACLTAAHDHVPLPPDMTVDIVVPSTSNTFYHVVGFGFFYVSCVHRAGDYCPGHALADANGIFSMNKINPNSVLTVEGYFVTGVPIDFGAGGGGGIDLGAYVLSLTE